MKKIMLVLLALTLCGCSSSKQPGITITPAGTKLQAQSAPPSATPIQESPSASVSASPSAQATPEASGADPKAGATDQIQKGMQKDIDLLIERNGGQTIDEQNYANQKKENLLTVERVTAEELKFADKPQVFKGDYAGRFTVGKQYKYYPDASAGGKRYYNVKDNFGVWISFQYSEPMK